MPRTSSLRWWTVLGPLAVLLVGCPGPAEAPAGAASPAAASPTPTASFVDDDPPPAVPRVWQLIDEAAQRDLVDGRGGWPILDPVREWPTPRVLSPDASTAELPEAGALRDLATLLVTPALVPKDPTLALDPDGRLHLVLAGDQGSAAFVDEGCLAIVVSTGEPAASTTAALTEQVCRVMSTAVAEDLRTRGHALQAHPSLGASYPGAGLAQLDPARRVGLQFRSLWAYSSDDHLLVLLQSVSPQREDATAPSGEPR